jgi:lysozyme
VKLFLLQNDGRLSMRIPARFRRISKKGVVFIAGFEGFRSHPYNDSAGYATVGYGHLIRYGPIRPNDKPISKRKALKLLKKDIRKSTTAVRKLNLKLTQAEFDALVSFAFNLGFGYFNGGHDMAKAIRSKKRCQIGNAFLEYDWAGHHRAPGLTRRRRRERRLFLSGRYH